MINARKEIIELLDKCEPFIEALDESMEECIYTWEEEGKTAQAERWQDKRDSIYDFKDAIQEFRDVAKTIK